MEPDLLDIGSNLGLTIQYQTIHEELINKLKVNILMIVAHSSKVLYQPYLGQTRSNSGTVDTRG